METLTVLVKFLLLLFSMCYISAQTCPACGSLVEGDSYTDGLIKGILNITTNSGTPCTQQITCSRLDASPNGFVALSATAEGIGNVNLGYDTTMASITLECSSSGKYIVSGFPEYPLSNNTIYCESTPATPVTTTIETLTTSASVNTCPACGNIIEGGSYTEGLVQGVLTITTNVGAPCIQQITCSRADTSDGVVALSTFADGIGHVELGIDMNTVSVTLECGGDGKYIVPGYPQFPLSNTLYCETTPSTPLRSTILAAQQLRRLRLPQILKKFK